MTIRHIHPPMPTPEARAETMARLSRRCLTSLAQLRRQENGKEPL